MPSPFPGMDPYLERRGEWAEFLHGELIVADEARDLTRRSCAATTARRTETMLFIHEPLGRTPPARARPTPP